MDLKISDENLKALVAKVILDEMGDETKKDVLMKSITHLINSKGSYREPSIIQKAWNQAVREACQETVGKMIKDDPEVTEAIYNMAKDVLLQLFTDEKRSQLVNDLAKGMSATFARNW